MNGKDISVGFAGGMDEIVRQERQASSKGCAAEALDAPGRSQLQPAARARPRPLPQPILSVSGLSFQSEPYSTGDFNGSKRSTFASNAPPCHVNNDACCLSITLHPFPKPKYSHEKHK